MPITTTTLANLIGRMNVYTPVNNLDQVRKVNALDQAIRMFRTKNQPPWTMKKSTIRVFQNVYLYPEATDHAQLAIIDDQFGQDKSFGEHPRYVYSSLLDFLQDPTARNMVAEIWQSGQQFLGVNNKTSPGLTEVTLDNASIAADWAGSNDAGTPVLDNVNFITGTSSIRVPVTSSSGVATVVDTFQNGVSTNNYKSKYFFEWVYLAAVPTSIEMRIRTSGANYLSGTVTTQFAGQPFITNDWNLIAIDLNTATLTGTIGSLFNDAVYILNGAATGNYFFDASYMRGWIIQDYWYYSKYNILNPDGSYDMYFAPDQATYDVSAILLGDTAWHDPMVYEACKYLLSDQKEGGIKDDVEGLRVEAWSNFFAKYPDNTPAIASNTYRFGTDYADDMTYPDITPFN